MPGIAVAVRPQHTAAIADEGWSELTALSPDAKRKHIHWTHVRTHDAAHIQPGQMTREQFWEHLVLVYKDVYPEAANSTGSILLFGGVAKEYHAESSQSSLRDEHHHGITYSSKQHLWKRVAKVSVEKYNVKMHAACHDGYASMYDYLRKPSSKKPLSELDAEFFLSPEHPRGDVLRRLLEAGARSARINHSRLQRTHSAVDAAAGGDGSSLVGSTKRIRVSDIYEVVRDGNFRTAMALQAHAESLSQRGDVALAKFCTVQGTMRLQLHLNAAWAVRDAPRALVAAPTRLAKMRECASTTQCICGGVWKAGAEFVLSNNNEDPKTFGRDVCRALALGAKRGVHMAVVGEPGSGKSMIFQPMESIFRTMPPPEDGSTFPLSGIVDAEIMLWQDFEYSQHTLHFMDLLRLLVGERVGVRIPGEKNVNVNNGTPLFYSALEKISPPLRSAPTAYQRKATAMDERFTIRTWMRPLPMEKRVADFPHCARCFSAFMLDNDSAWHIAHA